MGSNKKYIEVEARWINVDQKKIEAALKKAKAKKVGQFYFREWILEQDNAAWRKDRRRVRVRTSGKQHWLTYKANPSWGVSSTQEVEMTVSSPEAAVKFMEAVDVPVSRYQEKKMWQYKLPGDIIVEFSFWPKIPLVVEIEADSEAKVRRGAKLLGLSWQDAIFEDQKAVHSKFYGIDLDKEINYRFS